MNLPLIKNPLLVLFFSVLLSFPIFGQQIIGPENVNSARAVTMLTELIVIFFWLVRKDLSIFIPTLTKFQKLLFVIWLLFSILSVAFSDHVFVSAIRQLEWFTHILFLIALLSCFVTYPRYAEFFIFSVATAFLLIGTYLLFIWHTMENPLQHNWFLHPFVFGHIRHLAFFALAGFCASFYPLFRSEKPSFSSLILTFFSGAFCLSFIFWGGGRGSVLAAIITALFLLITIGKNRRVHLGIILVVIAISSYFAAESYKVDDHRMGLSLNHGKAIKNTDQISSGRLGIWSRVISNTADKPLTGMGPDGYLFMPSKNIETLHPHSFVVQFIGDWGWIGAIAFLALILSLTIKRYISLLQKRNSSNTPLSVVGASIVLSLSALGLVDGTFYHAWSLMLLFVGCAGLLTTHPALYIQRISFSADLKRLIGSFSLVLTILVALQIIVLNIVLSPAIPPPNSFKASLVRSFPSSTIGLNHWPGEWFKKYPEETLDWTRWLQTNSKDGWYYYFLESRFLNILGDKEKAGEKYRIGLSRAPGPVQKKLAVNHQDAKP